MPDDDCLRVYRKISAAVGQPVTRAKAIECLNERLPKIWDGQYRRLTGGCPDLVVVTFGNPRSPGDGIVSTMFDLASGSGNVEPRVVAVWGLSRSEPASTRDVNRMKGYLRNPKRLWSDCYPGRDRGHFFAHTMGGGTDINLFPQLSQVNRGGSWRMLENKAAAKAGTFCFIHPIYANQGWVPARLEYGLFDRQTFVFEGCVFAN